MAADARLEELEWRRAWSRRGVWLVAAIGAVVLVQLETFTNLVAVWWGTTAFNHCALIPFIAGFMAWTNRERLQRLHPASSWWAVAFVGANAVLWLAGTLLDINVALHVAAVGFVIGTVWALIGNQTASAFLFPLVYLYFMVPEGVFLVPYLQDWTATVLVALLRATDIPVFLEGRYLQIPSGHFHVAKACSGINYLLATLAVGSMYAYLNYVSYWRRAAFMLLAIAVPLIANGARAYGIVMIAHLSDYRYAMGVDHFIYGWVFFGIVIFALFAIGNLFSDVDQRSADVAPSRHGTDDARTMAVPPNRAFAFVLGALVFAAAVPRPLALWIDEAGVGTTTYAPPHFDGWIEADVAPVNLGGRFDGAGRIIEQVFENEHGARVQLLQAVFPPTRTTDSSRDQVGPVFDEAHWRLVSSVPVAQTRVAEVSRAHARHLRGAEGERLVWWWYQLGDRATASMMRAKLIEAEKKLLRNYAGRAVFVASVAIGLDGDLAEAEQTLRGFIRSARF